MRYWLPLERVTGSGNSLSLTQVSGDYYGALYFWGKKASSDSGFTAKVYAGDGARDDAIANDANRYAGTLAVPNGAAAWVTITNNPNHGPNLKNVKVYCDSGGTFDSALHAYTEELELEIANRMKLVIQNYCAADEQLYDMKFSKTSIQIGLGDDNLAKDRDFGIVWADSRDQPRTMQSHVDTRPRFIWTVWLKDHKNREATARLAYRMAGRLRTIAFDEQRTWGGLCLNTEPVGAMETPVPWILSMDGSPTRYGLKLRVVMECQQHGQDHEDHIHGRVYGGRYGSVDLSVS